MTSHAPILLSGSSHPELARRLASELGQRLEDARIGQFPDGELHVQVPESVRGAHVVILQSTSAPAERHLFELCLLCDACRREGAEQVTAVVPYFGYARHDRRVRGGQAVGVRVATDLLAAARIDRIASVDVHCTAVEAVSTVRFEHLSALPQLLPSVRACCGSNLVVIAPDLGAAKLAHRFGRALSAPVAVVHKLRLSGEDVEAQSLTGEVRGRVPLIVDDMISTAGTIEAAARVVLDAQCVPAIRVAATHGLFVGQAFERLGQLPIERVIVTDSVNVAAPSAFPIESVSLAPVLAQAIRAIDSGQSLELVRARP